MTVEERVKRALNNIEKTIENLHSVRRELVKFLDERIKEKQQRGGEK